MYIPAERNFTVPCTSTLILMYLLTAVGLTPAGSTVHIYT